MAIQMIVYWIYFVSRIVRISLHDLAFVRCSAARVISFEIVIVVVVVYL